jgi:hypothetical protein
MSSQVIKRVMTFLIAACLIAGGVAQAAIAPLHSHSVEATQSDGGMPAGCAMMDHHSPVKHHSDKCLNCGGGTANCCASSVMLGVGEVESFSPHGVLGKFDAGEQELFRARSIAPDPFPPITL